LTHPDAKPCLRDIIASYIDLPVKNVTVRNTELPISHILEKQERFDVNCEIDGGDQVEVEMQANAMKGDKEENRHKNIKSRAIFNACDLHAKQKGVGISYAKLARTYQITFCDYTVFEESVSCFSQFSFRDEKGEELLDAVNIFFVELSKLKQVLEKSVNAMTSAEMWAIFLAYANEPQYRRRLDEIMGVKEEIKVAYDLLTNISQDADERARFRARRKFQMDIAHDRIVSFEEGKLEGMLEGERKAKLEYARNLLANEVSLEIIAKSIGLSLDEIQSLANG
jgi:predicted transposase/invertase (TIGR01784 family)